jgi:hypothetical protein
MVTASTSWAGIVVSIPAPLDMSHVWMTVSAIRTMANIFAGITPAGAAEEAVELYRDPYPHEAEDPYLVEYVRGLAD